MINNFSERCEYIIINIIDIVEDNFITLFITLLMLLHIVLDLQKKYKFK